MRGAAYDIAAAIRWRVLLGMWILAMLSTALLVVTDAPTPVVTLVFAGLGTLLVAFVPATWGLARRLDYVWRAREGVERLHHMRSVEIAALRMEVRAHERSRRRGGWTTTIARALIESAARQLPKREQARYREEWLAEVESLDEVGGGASMVAFAYMVRSSAPRVAIALEQQAREAAEASRTEDAAFRARAHPDAATDG